MLEKLRRIVADRFSAHPLPGDFEGADPDVLREAHGFIAVDDALACPGDPDDREPLIDVLAPTQIVFASGERRNLAALAARSFGVHTEFLRSMHSDLAIEIEKLSARWESFQKQRRGY